jgi:O-antigen/teichoic acid export membrane protein
MPAPITSFKPWKEMTRRELIQSLVLFTIFGGVIAGIGVWKLVAPQPRESILLPIILIVFALSGVSAVYVGVIQELKRRKQKQK